MKIIEPAIKGQSRGVTLNNNELLGILFFILASLINMCVMESLLINVLLICYLALSVLDFFILESGKFQISKNTTFLGLFKEILLAKEQLPETLDDEISP